MPAKRNAPTKACTCCKPPQLFEDRKSLQHHVRTVKNEKTFICEFPLGNGTICGEPFSSNASRRDHYTGVHTNNEPVVCLEPGCGETFHAQYMLSSHKCRDHPEVTWRCKYQRDRKCGHFIGALTEKGITDHIKKRHPGESYDDLVVTRQRKQRKLPRATKWPRLTQESSSSSGSTPSSSSMVSSPLPRSMASSATPPQDLATPPSRLSSLSSTHQRQFTSIQPSPHLLTSTLPLDAADLAQVSWPAYSISDWQQSLARHSLQNQRPSTSSTPYSESPYPLAAGSSSSPAASFQDMYFSAPVNDLSGGSSARYHQDSHYPLAQGSSSSPAMSFHDTRFTSSMNDLGEGTSTSQNQHQRSIPRWFQEVQTDATPSFELTFDPSQSTAPLDPSLGSFMHTQHFDAPLVSAQQAPSGYPGDDFHSSPFQYPVPSMPASSPFGSSAPTDMPSTSESPFHFPAAPAPAPESTLFGGFDSVDLPGSSAFDPFFGQTIHISQHTAPRTSSSGRARYVLTQPPRIPRLPDLPQAPTRANTSYGTSGHGVPGLDFDTTATQPVEALQFSDNAPPLFQSTWDYMYPDGPDDLWDPVPENFEPRGHPGPGDGV